MAENIVLTEGPPVPPPPSEMKNDQGHKVSVGKHGKGRVYCSKNTKRPPNLLTTLIDTLNDEFYDPWKSKCGSNGGTRCRSCMRFHNGNLNVGEDVWLPPSGLTPDGLKEYALAHCSKCNLYVDPLEEKSCGWLGIANMILLPMCCITYKKFSTCPHCDEYLDEPKISGDCCCWPHYLDC